MLSTQYHSHTVGSVRFCNVDEKTARSHEYNNARVSLLGLQGENRGSLVALEGIHNRRQLNSGGRGGQPKVDYSSKFLVINESTSFMDAS